MMRFFVGIVVLWMAGCASTASQQAQTPQRRQGDLDIQGNASPSGVSAGIGCNGTSTSQYGLYSEGRRKLDGNKIMLSEGPTGGELSLCEVLRKTGKKAMFLQFAGVTCRECWDKSKTYSQVINSYQYQDVAWVVVLTDFYTDFSESAFQGYLDTHAPQALRMHDQAKLWKALSANPAVPIRSTAMAFNRNMDAVVVNQEGTPTLEILNAAVELAREVN